MQENEIMKLIQIEASARGHRLFRNNVGLFYTKIGTPVRCGLCPGGSDLVGFMNNGRWLSVEVKSPRGREQQDQIAFALLVQRFHGVAFTAHSVEEFIDKIKMYE